MDNLSAYTAMPYPGQVTTWTRPDHVAVVARLLGVSAPNPATARVLEVGCADGGNLLPLAARSPDATYVGLDLTPALIDRARRWSAAAGALNVSWVVADVVAPPDLTPFDYIIVHGVWSWVPEEARAAIFALCKHLLTPTGVAHISYNVLPGWSLRSPARAMLQWHAGEHGPPAERVAHAKELSRWLTGLPRNRRLLGTAMRSVFEDIDGYDDWYVFHEYLAVHNSPVFFHQFMAAARTAGLAYLGDASFSDLIPFDLPEEVQDALEARASDRETYEQYLDFLRERAFRRTLLVHEGVTPDFGVASSRLSGLHAAARVRLPADWGDAGEGHPQVASVWPVGAPPRRVEDVKGLTATSPAERLTVAALADAWPGSVAVDEVVREARETCGEDVASEVTRLLLIGFIEEAVHLSTGPSPCVGPSARPCVAAVTRAEAREPSRVVTHAWHAEVKVDAPQRWLLAQLDGQRDVLALAADMLSAAALGQAAFPADVAFSVDAIAVWMTATVAVFADTLLLVRADDSVGDAPCRD